MAKDCRSALPARAVEEDEGQEVSWGALMIEEIQDVDSAAASKMSNKKETVLRRPVEKLSWR